jgi:hypothetical protein
MNKLFVLFLFALAPTIALLLRGIVWGADSFAFMVASCGNTNFVNNLSSPLWFTNLLPYYSCNFYFIIFSMFFFYFLCLLSLKLIFDEFLTDEESFLAVFLLASVSPLFFIEALRFENQLFSFCMAFMSLALTLIALKHQNHKKVLFLAIIMALLSVSLWSASILILFIGVLLIDLPSKIKSFLFLLGLGTGIIIFHGYAISSFRMLFEFPGNLIAEEIPLIGIVFIIHLVTFVKYVPKQLLPYSILLLLIGLVKAKYVFLVTPFLILGLMLKHRENPINIKGDKIPLFAISVICLIGLILSSQFLYPLQSDIKEIDQAIVLSNDLNFPIKNDWGDGWIFVWRGYETPYKISNANTADFNGTGFIAYTKKDLPCKKVNTRTFIC